MILKFVLRDQYSAVVTILIYGGLITLFIIGYNKGSLAFRSKLHEMFVFARTGLFASPTEDRIKLNCIDRIICRPCFNQSRDGITMTIILFITSYIIPSLLTLYMNYKIIILLKTAQTVRKDYIMKAPPPPRAIVRVNNSLGISMPRYIDDRKLTIVISL